MTATADKRRKAGPKSEFHGASALGTCWKGNEQRRSRELRLSRMQRHLPLRKLRKLRKRPNCPTARVVATFSILAVKILRQRAPLLLLPHKGSHFISLLWSDTDPTDPKQHCNSQFHAQIQTVSRPLPRHPHRMRIIHRAFGGAVRRHPRISLLPRSDDPSSVLSEAAVYQPRGLE